MSFLDGLFNPSANDPNAVPKTLYDANGILIANTDNTPESLVVPASRLVGRAAAGGIAALDSSAVRTLLGIPDAEELGWAAAGDHFNVGSAIDPKWVPVRVGSVFNTSGVTVSATAIDPGANPGANTMRVSHNARRKSWLQIQPGTGGDAHLGFAQAVALPTNACVWLRCSYKQQLPGEGDQNNDVAFRLFIAANAGGVPDIDNRIEVSLDNDTAADLYWRSMRRVAATDTRHEGAGGHTAYNMTARGIAVLGIRKRGTNYGIFCATEGGVYYQMSANGQYGEHSFSPAAAWLGFTCGAGSSTHSQVYGFDLVGVTNDLDHLPL